MWESAGGSGSRLVVPVAPGSVYWNETATGESAMRHIESVVMFLVVILASAGFVAAQGTELEVVDSPYAEEFDYKVGQTLDLNLRLGGLRWSVLTVGAGDEADWREGKKVKTYFTNELENLTSLFQSSSSWKTIVGDNWKELNSRTSRSAPGGTLKTSRRSRSTVAFSPELARFTFSQR